MSTRDFSKIFNSKNNGMTLDFKETSYHYEGIIIEDNTGKTRIDFLISKEAFNIFFTIDIINRIVNEFNKDISRYILDSGLFNVLIDSLI